MTTRRFGWTATVPAAVLAGALAMPAPAAWPVPDPWKADHPGARDAPASSPTTYPDEKGFQERAKAIRAGLKEQDLSGYRRGWFAGGDPGKYVTGHAMARLLLDPADAEARRYMNDDRSYKEHYHFAAVNWARFLPIFGAALTDDIQAKLAAEAAKYGSYHSGPGTENHKVMWYTSALVLPHHLKGDGMLGRMPKDAVLKKMTAWLRSYVKGLYAAGQGEWDSSSYLTFDINGMLNIYDFSPDPEARLLAKAALDWYAAGYALKYTDGVYAGPHQRGYASGPCRTGADHTGYLWWGSAYTPTAEECRGFRYTLAPMTSSWRPNRALCRIARKDLPDLPFESRNSKPNYWMGHGVEPKANQSQETVYATRHFTLAIEWDRAWGVFADGRVFDQRTRLQLVAASVRGGVVFTGGHPWQNHYQDRKGKYDQRAQAGAAVVCLSRIPEDDGPPFAFFSIPEGASGPVARGGWMFMRAGETFLALFGLGEKAVVGESGLNEDQKKANQHEVEHGRPPKHKPFPVLRFEGRRTGFVLQAGDTTEFATLEAFMAAVAARCRVDASKWPDGNEVVFGPLDGRTLAVKYVEGAERPEVRIAGRPVDYAAWPVYGGPYLKQEGGVLVVNDGREGFVVDCSGERPVYRPWRP
jgi:hypothetical protein